MIHKLAYGQSGNLLYQAVIPGPVATEKLPSFVYKLHQPIAQQQKSCLKDTTRFINILEKNEGSREHTPCFNGHYELIYKYTTRGKNEHSVQCIESISRI